MGRGCELGGFWHRGVSVPLCHYRGLWPRGYDRGEGIRTPTISRWVFGSDKCPSIAVFSEGRYLQKQVTENAWLKIIFKQKHWNLEHRNGFQGGTTRKIRVLKMYDVKMRQLVNPNSTVETFERVKNSQVVVDNPRYLCPFNNDCSI